MDEKDNKNRSESKRRIYIKSCYLWKSIDRNGVKGGTIFIVIFEKYDYDLMEHKEGRIHLLRLRYKKNKVK